MTADREPRPYETAPVSFDFTDLRRTLRESAYTLTAFPIGLASFLNMVILISRRGRHGGDRRRASCSWCWP